MADNPDYLSSTDIQKQTLTNLSANVDVLAQSLTNLKANDNWSNYEKDGGTTVLTTNITSTLLSLSGEGQILFGRLDFYCSGGAFSAISVYITLDGEAFPTISLTNSDILPHGVGNEFLYNTYLKYDYTNASFHLTMPIPYGSTYLLRTKATFSGTANCVRNILYGYKT